MTLDEFIASKRHVADMAKELPNECWDEHGPAQAGYIYATQFHIEEIGPHWPEAPRLQGHWYLLLGNEEYISYDLARLEVILYDYACMEMAWPRR